MAEQNYKNLIKDIISILNPRVREVIEKRFGLSNNKTLTLEAIGKHFGITRERVRQIEADGLKQLGRDAVLAKLEPAFQMIVSHIKSHGGIRREADLLKEAGAALFPEEKNAENLINFVLALGAGKLVRHDDDDNLHSTWSVSNAVRQDAVTLAAHLKKQISSDGLQSHDKLLNNLKTEAARFSNLSGEANALASYLALCRHIARNPYGQWGPANSPEVSPRGVKDKAYLVLRREQKPLHFRQVCDSINKTCAAGRKAHPQTVHNELIKDSRFILVGRGTYALRDWGYEPGTVKDVIINVLKKSDRPLTREEIIKNVLAKRLVKENTILLNLQNRKVFKKTEGDKFVLA